MDIRKRPFTSASREEIEIDLQVSEGELPNDLSGHAYFNSPVGTVNNTTPIPEKRPDGTHNPEWGQMIFNGDGMVLRFDMDKPGVLSMKSSLLKTPCYWADYNSRYGTDYYDKGLHFNSAGMARTSMTIGSRNQINTSINLFKFPGDKYNRVTANFDAGRPFELDPKSMELVTPIGRNLEWQQEMPVFLNNTFELVQSTAHPSFDPLTKEFFSVCFQKDFNTLILSDLFKSLLEHEEETIKKSLTKLYHEVFKHLKLNTMQMVSIMKDFTHHLSKKKANPDHPDYALEHAKSVLEKGEDKVTQMTNAVSIKRWTGAPDLDSWNLVDENGENIVIHQTMHQTALSKDYIILVDSSLKFALDVLINVPFPEHPWLNRLLRWITSKTIEPTTPMYIVKRADLKPGVENVLAKEVTIPLETVHYSVEYDNPNGLITMFTSHNSALCAAEWVRPYDTLAIDPKRPIEQNTIGLFTCGEMDINRISKIVLDAEAATIKDAVYLHDKGFDGNDVKNITRAHTWAVGLNTFRDELSADIPNVKIPYMFWQFYGLDYRMLTNFIKEMYENYQNRIIPVEDVLEYTKKGVPFCLSRLNTSSMEFDDFYLFKMNQNLRSLQFVPRSVDSKNQHPEEALNGYILCTMINGPENFSGDEYTREIWIFDAANLKQGPVTKLSHPDLDFAFTIHSVWSPDCEPSPANYKVDIVEDYTAVVDSFNSENKKKEMMAFLKDTVFPYYQ